MNPAADPDIAALEAAFVGQWTNYGEAPGARFVQEEGLVWTEAPVPQLPYNAVLATRLEGNADARIADRIRDFRARNVQFIWVVHPSAQPKDLGRRLEQYGMKQVETGTGMALDLASWRVDPIPEGPVSYVEVADAATLAAFEKLMVLYWELTPASQDYALRMNRWAYSAGNRGIRWVAMQGGEAVGKAYLSHLGQPDTGAIFGVYVRPEARGLGIASTLTRVAIDRAAKIGRKRVVLHSSAMAKGAYLRLGFAERCEFPIYATTPLHGVHPL